MLSYFLGKKIFEEVMKSLRPLKRHVQGITKTLNGHIASETHFSNFVSFQYFDSVPTAKLLPCLRGIQRHHPGVKILRIRKVTSL